MVFLQSYKRLSNVADILIYDGKGSFGQNVKQPFLVKFNNWLFNAEKLFSQSAIN